MTLKQAQAIIAVVALAAIAVIAGKYAIGASDTPAAQTFPTLNQRIARVNEVQAQLQDAFPGDVDVYIGKDFDLNKPSLSGVVPMNWIPIGDQRYIRFFMPEDKSKILINQAHIAAVRVKRASEPAASASQPSRIR